MPRVDSGGNWVFTTPAGDVDSKMSIPLGNVEETISVNKFGRNTDIDTASEEDIWSGGGLYVAPTEAQTHNIASTSINDTNAGSLGAKKVRVYGLMDWDTKEVNELIEMNGTTDVETTNEYVIIHRMVVEEHGASTNAGVITATGTQDATVTAQIETGIGQTEMAIYAIPSVQTAYMTNFYASVNKQSSASVDVKLLVASNPATYVTVFTTKHTTAVHTQGTTAYEHTFNPYKRIAGPALIKIRCGSSSNNADVSAGFDLILKDN